MKVIDLYEKIKNDWPASESLDNLNLDVAEMYTDGPMDEDIQDIDDWMQRVKKNFPMLYVSQAKPRGKK